VTDWIEEGLPKAQIQIFMTVNIGKILSFSFFNKDGEVSGPTNLIQIDQQTDGG